MDALFDSLIKGKLAMPQEGSLRESVLNILFRVYQRRPEMKNVIEPVLYQHISNLFEACKTIPEREEFLKEEIELAKKVLDAPNQNMRVNYQETELKRDTVQQE